MANIKSAEKQARQALVRKDRNQKTKGAVRTAEKKLRTLIAGGDKTKVEEALREFTSKISKAAQKGMIKKNTASRKIGRMNKFIFKGGNTDVTKATVAKATVAKAAKPKVAAKSAATAKTK